MPITKVLIPLDGSVLSRSILSHVRRWLPPGDNTLILLRVTERPAGLTPLPPLPESLAWPVQMYKAARDVELAQHPIYANQAWDSIRARLEDELVPVVHDLQAAGYTVAVAVRFGQPVEEIVTFVETEGVDLVAMATHGRTGLPRLVLGSVAEAVLHRLQVPLLLVRPFGHASGDPTDR